LYGVALAPVDTTPGGALRLSDVVDCFVTPVATRFDPPGVPYVLAHSPVLKMAPGVAAEEKSGAFGGVVMVI
jgi:hypothetical protein